MDFEINKKEMQILLHNSYFIYLKLYCKFYNMVLPLDIIKYILIFNIKKCHVCQRYIDDLSYYKKIKYFFFCSKICFEMT